MPVTTTSFKMKASSSEGDYELPPTGQQPAVLIGLIDLGTHSRTFGAGANAKTTTTRKLLFVWELVAETSSKGEQFVVAQDFTWSLNQKANLRKFLEGWIGRSLKEEEEYDFALLLGQPCVLNLSEGQTGNGKKFVEVASAAKPMRGLNVPPASNAVFAFSIDAQTNNAPPDLPDWVPPIYGRKVIDDITASEEWGRLAPF